MNKSVLKSLIAFAIVAQASFAMALDMDRSKDLDKDGKKIDAAKAAKDERELRSAITEKFGSTLGTDGSLKRISTFGGAEAVTEMKALVRDVQVSNANKTEKDQASAFVKGAASVLEKALSVKGAVTSGLGSRLAEVFRNNLTADGATSGAVIEIMNETSARLEIAAKAGKEITVKEANRAAMEKYLKGILANKFSGAALDAEIARRLEEAEKAGCRI